MTDAIRHRTEGGPRLTIAAQVTLATSAVALVTAALALPLALVYFERRLPPETLALIESQLAGGDFDGAGELGLLALLAAAVGIVVGQLLARRIAGPLHAVSQAARRVAAGDLTARAKTSRRPVRSDEAGRLAWDFDRMAEALQRLDQERVHTSAAIAHELRTPLTIVQARLEALRDGLLVVTEQEIDLLLRQIRALSRLVDDLKVASLSDAGEFRPVRRPIDLGVLAEAVARAHDVGRAVEIRVDNSGPPGATMVAGDPDRLTQVVGNLLSNAVRFTPDGGQVQVRVDRVDDRVRLRVRNDGEGISVADQARVFERFWSSGSVLTGAEAGSGQGLAVVKIIAEAHGGTAEVHSAPGEGAEFVVWIPAAH